MSLQAIYLLHILTNFTLFTKITFNNVRCVLVWGINCVEYRLIFNLPVILLLQVILDFLIQILSIVNCFLYPT